MSEKKHLNEEKLEKVSGGIGETDKYVDVKTVIDYSYLGETKTEEVVFKIEVINNIVYEKKILEAIYKWCEEHSYKYERHFIASDNGAYYRYVMLDKLMRT